MPASPGTLPGLLVFGGGRMGRLVAEAAQGQGFELRAVVARQQPSWLDPALWRAALKHAPQDLDLVIDFSLPDGTQALAPWCADAGLPLLSGTTGLGESGQTALQHAAAQVPVLWAANYSIGVNVCLGLVAAAARQLQDAQAVVVHERHHLHKKDAPSGTALALGAAAAPWAPTYESLREGEVIGDHQVRFEMAGETVEISHFASDRGIYARGALQAGHWLRRQSAGLYSAQDWLGG